MLFISLQLSVFVLTCKYLLTFRKHSPCGFHYIMCFLPMDAAEHGWMTWSQYKRILKSDCFEIQSKSWMSFKKKKKNRDPGGSLCKRMYWEGLVPISVRVKGAECMGAKLQRHIPAQVNMGYIFRKKNMGPLHPRFKEKRLYFSRTISKNGYLFLPKWPLTMVTSPGGYSTLAWTEVCRPDLGTLTHV